MLVTPLLSTPDPGVDASVETEELLVVVHRAAATRAQSRLDAAVALEGDDVVGCLEALLPLDAPRRRDWSVWFAVWSVADTRPDLAAEHRRFLVSTFTDLRRVVVAARRSGRLPADVDADRWTRRALAALYEVAVAALLDPRAWPPARQCSELGALIGTGHRAADRDDLVPDGAVVVQDRDAAVRDGLDHPA